MDSSPRRAQFLGSLRRSIFIESNVTLNNWGWLRMKSKTTIKLASGKTLPQGMGSEEKTVAHAKAEFIMHRMEAIQGESFLPMKDIEIREPY